MKRLPLITCYIALASLCYSCLGHREGDTSISISESKHFYTMSAYFSKSKTRRVQECIDKHLNLNNDISFVNVETDGVITLDDKTKFHIKLVPGELEIKLDKKENSYESYTEIKEMCEGIKIVIGEK